MSTSHAARLDAIVFSFDEAMARLTSRLQGASPEAAERSRDDGGWSVAQIGWHVAAVNTSFASIADGTFPIAKPIEDGFTERTWSEVEGGIAEKLQAPSRVHPPASVTRDEALSRLEASRAALTAAIRGLDPERARMTIESPIVGRVTLYQVGEWAVAHVIRHNRQMKRMLEGL